MRAVMTGGGGFMGSHLLARLVGSGMNVTLIGPDLGRSRYTASVVSAGVVRFLKCDPSLGDEAALRALDDADFLVPFGYRPPTGASAPQRVLEEIEANVVPLARLISAFARPGRHVVFASSDSVYGTPVRIPVRECDPTQPRSEFGIAKLACEQALRACSAAGSTVSIMRYGTVYGPGETASRAIPNFIRAALAGQAPVVDGDGAEEHDYIHVADAVEATMSAIRRRHDGICNVGTGIGTTAVELADLVVWVTGGCAAPVHRPDAQGGPRRMSVVLDTSLARSELGFAPRHSLPEGLTEEVGWFKAAFGSDLKTAA
jgi:UDP-glucose 4-epimerase